MKPKNFFLLVCVLSIQAQLVAYPISPRPLRKLVIESDCIITGYVRDIKEKTRKKKDDWFGGHYAEVIVSRVLQGTIKDSVMRIEYSPNMICPAPPHFIKDTHVMVFLDKTKDGYRVHALSYGVKTLTPGQLEIYTARVAEMRTILKADNEDDQFKQTIEWLVTCAENPVTRYEGVYELSPDSDFMSYYDRTQSQPFQYLLTVEQKFRLKAALLADTESQYANFGLVDLVYAGNEQEIFNYMLDRLLKLGENQLWYAEEFMKRLVLYKPSEPLNKIIETFDEMYYNYNEQNNKQLLSLIDSFIKEIKTL